MDDVQHVSAAAPFASSFEAQKKAHRMPFAGHSDPTEAQLEWQMMTNLAYGSKGLQYVSLL